MKKVLAILVSFTMIFALAATTFAAPAEVTWEDYQQYLIDTAGANAPDLAEFTAQVEAIGSWEDIDQTVSPWDQFFTTLGLSTWEEFEAGEVKELAVQGAMGGGDSAEGESPEGESPAEEAAPAEGEVTEDNAAAPEGESPAGESPEGESPEGESPAGEAPSGTKQDISELKASSFTTNNTDATRPGDEGHIYVGYAITDGKLDADNSNWETDDVENIALDNVVEGEGFTAIRAWGDTTVNVTGTLIQQDTADGTYASDFTGTGAGITVAEGATVNVKDMMYLSSGFGRSFGIVENGIMIIDSSDITALGADPFLDSYDGYYNSAQTSMMLSPPWVLGIQGGIRAVNVLGRTNPSTFVAKDSSITAGGWAAVSTDGCTTPQLYFYNTQLAILPQSEGGMNSGWAILGYEEGLYGSGYGTYFIGDASESFYGTTITGSTYGSILRGGLGIFEGLKAGQTYEAKDVNGNVITTYEAKEDVPTVINTVFGIMNHGGGTINFNEGSVWNTAESTVLCKEADTVWNFNGAELNPGNGIIFEMIDNDDNTVGGFNPFGTYLTEEAGFPLEGYADAVSYVFTEDQAVDPSKTYYQADVNAEGGYAIVEEPTQEGIIAYYERSTGGGKVEVSFADGEYTGDVYNATGYYAQAPDALIVTIADNATLEGDIALSSHIHGIFLNDRAVDDVIAAIEEADAYHANIGGYYEGLEDIEYVFLDENGSVTEDKDAAVAIQFTKFSTAEYYLLGQVLHMINYNGLSTLDVNVEGTWKVVRTSLVTYLNVAEGAHVYGEITELEDGTILLKPAETELEAGEYGKALVYVEPAGSGGGQGGGESAGGEGGSEGGGESGGEPAPGGEGESAEGAAPQGESAEAPAEGGSPEGESPEGEAPAAPEGESAEAPAEEAPAASAAPAEGDMLEAYKAYMNEWLMAEYEVNSAMTEEQILEFQACIEANDYTQFPGDMFFNGMLENGVAMTYDEFVAAQK